MPENRNIDKNEFFDTEFNEGRANDSESKISELMKEDIAQISQKLNVPVEDIKVINITIKTTFDPCNVCKKELLLLEEYFGAPIEIYRPFYTNKKGVKEVVINTETFNMI